MRPKLVLYAIMLLSMLTIVNAIPFQCTSGLTGVDPYGGNGVEVLRFQNETGGDVNAHVQLVSDTGLNYSNTIYCNESTMVVGNVLGTSFLRVSDTTNAHVQPEWVGTYSNELKIYVPNASLQVNIRNSCLPTETCLFSSMSDTGGVDNAHIGVCGHYPSNYCLDIPDLANPSVTNMFPSPGSMIIDQLGSPIQFGADILDGGGLSSTYALVTYPNGTTENITLIKNGLTQHNNSFTLPSNLQGYYNISYTAIDSYGNVNDTETTYFGSFFNLTFDTTSLTYVNILEDEYDDTIDLDLYTTYSGVPGDLSWSCNSDDVDFLTPTFSTSFVNLTSTNNQNGIVNISCQVDDGVQFQDSNFLVNVTPVNDPPTFNVPDFQIFDNATASINLTDYTFDVDNLYSELTWSVVSVTSPAIADCTIVNEILTIDSGLTEGNSTCNLDVTDGGFIVFDTTTISVAFPPFNFSATDSGIEWMCVTW